MRVLNLRSNFYDLLRGHFHGDATKLDRLAAL
jgi:hypothetical protein